MKISTHLNLACSVLLCAMASCAAPEGEANGVQPTEPRDAAPPLRPTNSFWADADYVIRGNVVDGSGAPIAAKVELVDAHGSTSTSASAGKFELGAYRDFPQTLCAWTKDGKIGWRVLESPPADGLMTISVVEVGAFLTLVPGDGNDRVSILSGQVPLHDVKFPAGEARTFVVPAGEISFGTKGMNGQAADRRSARMSPGSTLSVSF
ncbi:MAG: hypothetical protein ACJA2W_000960 [Planctomycetota bacterium]|jgi:hypothetical protein